MFYGENGTVTFLETLADNVFRISCLEIIMCKEVEIGNKMGMP
jgi:hypothetical protein